MENLTLVIPAKNEADSLPNVLKEIESFKCRKIIIIEENDQDTIQSINSYDCKIVFQDKKGYGDAIIKGINSVDTEYLCIFNADGSFNPKYLHEKLELCKNYDFIFSSRYMKGGGSDDDTFITIIGNFIFSLLGNILFSLKLSDILYTFILGKTESFKSLNLECHDFCLCVEIPVKAKRMKASYIDLPSYERRRMAGYKKVNEFKDGFKILIYMIKLFLRIK